MILEILYNHIRSLGTPFSRGIERREGYGNLDPPPESIKSMVSRVISSFASPLETKNWAFPKQIPAYAPAHHVLIPLRLYKIEK